MKKLITTFDTGGCWESSSWKIEGDVAISGFNGSSPCKHGKEMATKTHENAYGGTYTETFWECPSVVVAYNEGGYRTTGVCLDCILEYGADWKRSHAL